METGRKHRMKRLSLVLLGSVLLFSACYASKEIRQSEWFYRAFHEVGQEFAAYDTTLDRYHLAEAEQKLQQIEKENQRLESKNPNLHISRTDLCIEYLRLYRTQRDYDKADSLLNHFPDGWIPFLQKTGELLVNSILRYNYEGDTASRDIVMAALVDYLDVCFLLNDEWNKKSLTDSEKEKIRNALAQYEVLYNLERNIYTLRVYFEARTILEGKEKILLEIEPYSQKYGLNEQVTSYLRSLVESDDTRFIIK